MLGMDLDEPLLAFLFVKLQVMLDHHPAARRSGDV